VRVEEYAYYVNKLAKMLLWKMNMTSNCDVAKSAHQMTTICH